MIARDNRACGTFVTPFIPGKFRPTPLKLDGTRYSWTLTYDPDANDGNGRFRFTIKSHGAEPEPLDAKRLPADFPAAHREEALSHFPNTTEFSVDLPAGFEKEGATFDRFGLLNMTKPGKAMTIYFGDLEHDGHADDFGKDRAGWVTITGRRSNPRRPGRTILALARRRTSPVGNPAKSAAICGAAASLPTLPTGSAR